MKFKKKSGSKSKNVYYFDETKKNVSTNQIVDNNKNKNKIIKTLHDNSDYENSNKIDQKFVDRY